VQTTAQFHVTVSPAPAVSPAPGAGPGGGAAPVGFDGAAPPDGCRAGPRRTTRCDTLYGFGQGSTPFTVSGTISYGGNPVCVNYVGGRICNGWFGVWGADGIPDNGNSGSGLGTSALAVASVGGIGAEAQSDPTALYVSRAPSGQDSDLTVRSYTTLLDLSVGTEPDSAQCAPTKITNTIVTPSATRPQAAVQWPISCVDEIAVDSLGGRAARTGPVSTLLGAQRLLGQGRNAAALASLVAAASAAHQTLVATAHAGLPTAAQRPSDATVERSGCPVLNAALVPDGGHPPPFACTQGSFPVWQAVIPGQSLVSSQLTTEAIAESAGTTGLFHLVLAFDTVEVGECWPAAACR
jgi:hypothetical protein